MVDEKLNLLFKVIGLSSISNENLVSDNGTTSIFSEQIDQKEVESEQKIKTEQKEENLENNEIKNTDINNEVENIEQETDKDDLTMSMSKDNSTLEEEEEVNSKKVVNHQQEILERVYNTPIFKGQLPKNIPYLREGSKTENQKSDIEVDNIDKELTDKIPEFTETLGGEKEDLSEITDTIGTTFQNTELLHEPEVKVESKITKNELEAFIILLNKYNININGRSRQSKGLFDFGYISGPAVITRDDLVVYVEKEEPEEKTKKGLLSWLSKNKNKEKQKMIKRKR